jgi:adenylate kinase
LSIHKHIAFLGGIHGVGKTTVCKELCIKMGFRYLSASEVIKWEDASQKQVDDIKDTQNRLTQNLSRVVDLNHNYFLDGHFCLINRNRVSEPIPLQIFKNINPFCLNVLVADVGEIQKRLETRDGKRYKLSFLNDMQNTEVRHADYVSRSLNLPLNIIRQDNYLEVTEHIKNQMTKANV